MPIHSSHQTDATSISGDLPERARSTFAADEFAVAQAGPWDVAEELIAEYLQTHRGPVVVDLDETLYLRNSTEDFIQLATPGLLAAYLLRLLDLAAPWRWTGGQKCRDNWRIGLVLALFPWTYWRWRHHCRHQVSAAVNRDLQVALQNYPYPVIIASNGYGVLIRPMLAALNLPGTTLVCCNLSRFHHRRDGKLALLDPTHDRAFIARSLVITDSHADADLLAACKTPCLTAWKKAAFKRAFDGLAYLPGDYLSRVKRPHQGALRHLVIYNLLPWILVGLSSSASVTEVLGLTALFLSLWSIYEWGYYDNDRCAIKYERTPKLTPEAQTFNGYFLVPSSG